MHGDALILYYYSFIKITIQCQKYKLNNYFVVKVIKIHLFWLITLIRRRLELDAAAAGVVSFSKNTSIHSVDE